MSKKKKNTQINKIRNECGNSTTNSREIKIIMRIVWAIVYQQIGQPSEMDKFLETYNYPKLNYKEMGSL